MWYIRVSTSGYRGRHFRSAVRTYPPKWREKATVWRCMPRYSGVFEPMCLRSPNVFAIPNTPTHSLVQLIDQLSPTDA